MARLQKKSRRQSPQVQPNIRHSLRDSVTIYTRSPRGPALLPPSLRDAKHRRKLTSAPGGQDHATSPSAPCPSSAKPELRCGTPRLSHSVAHVRDDRDTSRRRNGTIGPCFSEGVDRFDIWDVI